MMQSAFLCVTLDVKHKKIPFLGVLTWFLRAIFWENRESQDPRQKSNFLIILPKHPI